jgi:hypothetical protein
MRAAIWFASGIRAIALMSNSNDHLQVPGAALFCVQGCSNRLAITLLRVDMSLWLPPSESFGVGWRISYWPELFVG